MRNQIARGSCYFARKIGHFARIFVRFARKVKLIAANLFQKEVFGIIRPWQMCRQFFLRNF